MANHASRPGSRLCGLVASDGYIGYDVKINWPGYSQGRLPTGPTTVEVMLHDLGGAYAFVPFRGPEAVYLAEDQRVRLGDREQVPRQHYAGVIFLDKSPAMTYVR